MSYFTYHGKLGDELIVAVLPNGTVEADDPVYVYTDKKAMSYTVRYTSVTKDGDDEFTFHDGYYEFEAVATNAYQSLNLTRKAISNGKTATVALTRQYSQPQTVTPQSNSPKIWTGTINFHSWAKEEPFVIVAPKGVGNEKPIVAIWQWTKDNKGTPNTLSHSTEKQISKPASPTHFSFKQAGYYDVTCQVNVATSGLAVTVSDATNSAVSQKELVLLPQRTLNAEHRFNPPKGVTEKKSLDCSRPNAKPALPRITEPLPFPEDLVDCLAHVAAYVDRAGYHAKFSQKQFDKLDRAFHLSEEKVEKRDTTIVKLKGDIAGLETENKDLKKRNDALQKDIDAERERAKECEKALREQLKKALDDLRASQGREKDLAAKIVTLEEYICRDAEEDADRAKRWDQWKKQHEKADAERQKKWEDHDKADHEAFKRVQCALEESEENGRRLSGELIKKQKEIDELQSKLDATKCELETARAEIDRLNLELVTELAYKVELQQELEAAKEKLRCAENDLVHLRQQVANLTESLAAEKKCRAAAEEKLECEKRSKIEVQKKLENAEHNFKEALKDVDRLKKDVEEQEDLVKDRNTKIIDLRKQLQETEDAEKKTAESAQKDAEKHKEVREAWEEAKKARNKAIEENDRLTALRDKKVNELKKQIQELKDHDKTHTHSTTVAD